MFKKKNQIEDNLATRTYKEFWNKVCELNKELSNQVYVVEKYRGSLDCYSYDCAEKEAAVSHLEGQKQKMVSLIDKYNEAATRITDYFNEHLNEITCDWIPARIKPAYKVIADAYAHVHNLTYYNRVD